MLQKCLVLYIYFSTLEFVFFGFEICYTFNSHFPVYISHIFHQKNGFESTEFMFNLH